MPFSRLESAASDITKSKPGQKAKEMFNKAYPTKVSSLKFADVTSLDRPAPTWRWLCSFPTIEGLTLDQIRCENIDLPLSNSIQSNDIFMGGSHYTFVQSSSYETLSAEFYETEDYSTTAYFLAWKNTAFNASTKTYGLPVDYLKSVDFTLLPVVEIKDGSYAKVTLNKCFPITIGKFGFGSETGRVKVKVDFAVHEISFETSKGTKTAKGIAKMDAASALQKALKWKA